MCTDGNLQNGSKSREVTRTVVSGGLLCEPLDEGGLRVLSYCGSDSAVCLPGNAAEVADNAFLNAENIDQLVLYEGVRIGGMDSFHVKRPPHEVIVHLTHPVDARDTVTVYFAQDRNAVDAFRNAFRSKTIDAALVVHYADSSLVNEMYSQYGGALDWYRNDAKSARDRDPYDASIKALRRLADPFLLDGSAAEMFRNMFSFNLESICSAFAEHNQSEGFELLCDAGLLTADNIGELAIIVHEAGNPGMASLILNMKRQMTGACSGGRGASCFDLDL